MKLHVITWQHRSDFEAILHCEHCGEFQSMGYGYDDDRFHEKVIPTIKCVACGKRSNEIIPSGISDPGFQHGIACELRDITVKKWFPK